MPTVILNPNTWTKITNSGSYSLKPEQAIYITVADTQPANNATSGTVVHNTEEFRGNYSSPTWGKTTGTRESTEVHVINSGTQDSPATKMAILTPNDSTDLTVTPKALRIYVPTTGNTVRVALSDDIGNPVTLTFPAGVYVELIRITRLYSTGTSAGVIVHGYLN